MKNIVLYEHYDGVRFILERSLLKTDQKINIQSSNIKNEIKRLIDLNNLDLLITELSRVHPAGLELSRYARKSNPDLKIIWITLLGCDVFREIKNQIGNILCIEKPLEINDFRRDVYKALEMSANGG
jgi:DNA-binding NtrC family response regulator